ncbi:acyl-CoA dehydrogenase family protein, partial [Geminicoccus flavidas]|uniref:acyl-CoA dehydrogenase family protein n=1 Tax=Geminicoccus flavidas TaxID=2506407 RepID=UPI00190FB94C
MAIDDARLEGLAARLAAQAGELDRSAASPHGPLQAFAELGLTGLTVPVALGGGGWGIEPVIRLLARLAAAEPASSLVLAMTLIQQAQIARNGRLAQHLAEQVGRQGVAGAYLNALRVEPELGSPARGGLPATVATRTSSGWRISGQKRFCTGIEALALALVWARTDEAAPRVGQ